MAGKRVLIVEADEEFGLSVASVLRGPSTQTELVKSARDALKSLEERPADLTVVRAELPETSGFAFTGRLRKAASGLKIMLISSEANDAAIEQHRAGPAPADDYLLIPFPMAELAERVNALIYPNGVPSVEVSPPEPTLAEPPLPPAPDAPDATAVATTGAEPAPPPPAAEGELPSGDDVDSAIEGIFSGESIGKSDPLADVPDVPREAYEAAGQAPPPIPGQADPTLPPSLPERRKKDTVTPEDIAFVDGLFGTIADRKTELLAEARKRQSEGGGKKRRKVLGGPEEKLQALREELKDRDISLARLSEIWKAKDLENRYQEERVHEKEVEAQKLKLQLQEMIQRLTQARKIVERREREHSDLVESLLSQKVMEEKDLIEVVAGKEKQINDLYRELRAKGDDISSLAVSAEHLQSEYDELDRRSQRDLLAAEMRESNLRESVRARESEVANLLIDLALARDDVQARTTEAQAREALQTKEHKALQGRLEQVESDLEWRIRRLTQEVGLRDGTIERVRADIADLKKTGLEREQELTGLLTEAETNLSEVEDQLEKTRQQRDGIAQSLRGRLVDRAERIATVEGELTDARAEAVRREAELGEALQAAETQGETLEGELESNRQEAGALEEALRAEVSGVQAELVSARGDATHQAEEAAAREDQVSAGLSSARERIGELEGEYEALAAAKSELEGELRGEMQVRDEQIASMAAARADLESQLQAAQVASEEASDQLRSAKNEMEGALRGEIGLREERIAVLEADVEQAGTDIENLRGIRETLEGTLAAKTDEASELGAGLEEARNQVEGLKATLGDRDTNIASLEQELTETRDHGAGVQTTLQEKVRGAAERIAALQGELAAVQAAATSDANDLRSEVSDRDEQVHRLTEELAGARREAAETQQQLTARDQESAARGAQIEQLGAQLGEAGEAARASTAEQQQQLTLAQESGEKAREAAASAQAQLQGEIGNRDEQLAAQAKELEATRAEGDELQKKVARAHQETEKARMAGVARADELASSLQQAEEAKEQTARALEASKQQGAALEESLGKKFATVDAKLRESEAKRKATLEKANSFIEQAKGQIVAYKKKVAVGEKRLADAEGSRRQLEKTLGARAEAAEKVSSEARSRYKLAMGEIRELKGKVVEAGKVARADLKAEMEQREGRRAQELQRLQSTLQEKSRALKVAELEVKRLKARVGSAARGKKVEKRKPPPEAPEERTMIAKSPIESLSDIDLDDEDAELDEITKNLGG